MLTISADDDGWYWFQRPVTNDHPIPLRMRERHRQTVERYVRTHPHLVSVHVREFGLVPVPARARASGFAVTSTFWCGYHPRTINLSRGTYTITHEATGQAICGSIRGPVRAQQALRALLADDYADAATRLPDDAALGKVLAVLLAPYVEASA